MKTHAKSRVGYQKGYYEENRGKIKKYYEDNREKVAAKQMARKYGITPGDFERMRATQGGVCAICSGSGGKTGLGVDHDHTTRKVRALLCGSCNRALGLLKDSSALVLSAARYLKLHGK